MTSTTPGNELSAINTVNILGVWMICMTLGCELRALKAMNNSRLWMI